MTLQGKTIVVTGVGPGLGREVAERALREGANLVIAARTAAKVEQTAHEIDPTGSRVLPVAADITNAADDERIVRAGVERFGGIDGLVQVAAYDSLFGGVMDTDLDGWRRTFETNVFGTVQLVKAAVPALRERGGGSIVLIGSLTQFLPTTPQIAYGSSKGALLTATYHMARELGPNRIRVNMVVPSWMWGPPVQTYVAMSAKQRAVSEEKVIAEIASVMPLGEIPTDGDVAETAVFLASDRARMITGQAIQVNGGHFLR